MAPIDFEEDKVDLAIQFGAGKWRNAEACTLLAEDEDARAIAGGQTLVQTLAMRLARPAKLVDIMRPPELAGIRAEAGALLVVWLVFVLVGFPLLILALHHASGVVSSDWKTRRASPTGRSSGPSARWDRTGMTSAYYAVRAGSFRLSAADIVDEASDGPHRLDYRRRRSPDAHLVLPRGYRPVGYSSVICFRCNVLQALFPLCQATSTLSFRVNP